MQQWSSEEETLKRSSLDAAMIIRGGNPKAVFLTYCHLMTEILQWPADSLTGKTLLELTGLVRTMQISVQWIPAHCSIWGNEQKTPWSSLHTGNCQLPMTKPAVACWQSDQRDHAEINRAGTHLASYSAVDACSMRYLVEWADILLGKGRKQTTTSHLEVETIIKLTLHPRKLEGPNPPPWATATDHHLLS